MLKNLFTLLIILFYQTSIANEEGMIINVIDGDTVHLLNQNHDKLKVRLLNIDAPELDQSYGRESKMILERFILNKNVTVIWNKKDRYKRLLGVIFIDGVDFNLEMIKAGAAWHFKKYAKHDQAKDQYQIYNEYEQQAKLREVGLWGENATPPWLWRKNKK
jgi:micrococcal nuclease